MKIGYHASHEQFSPSDLLKLVVKAEQAGFQAVLSSDHFYPWSEEQGQSGFAWSWLGAAMQATSTIDFGIVNAPGQRYHPAIIAQAVATLAEMFPQRFWIAIGSGQRLNEHITGTEWPVKLDRNIRLQECAEVMNAMWEGETVNKNGTVKVENAKLYTLPAQKPLLIGAALSEETARFVATWADGMITVSDKPENVKKVMDAFRENGGEGKPIYLKAQLSYARSESVARDQAFAQWRNNVIDRQSLSELKTPGEFDIAGNLVTEKQVASKVFVSTSLEQYFEVLYEFEKMGIEKVFLHNVNRMQEEFIEDFGKHVLPGLKRFDETPVV